MSEKQFHQRWKRLYKAALEEVQTVLAECRRTGDVGAVHRLRVALRRARLLALVGKPVLGRSMALRLRQWAFKLTAALSRVRDYDAALEWLNRHSPDSRTVDVLTASRLRLWRASRPHLRTLPQRAWDDITRTKAATAKQKALRKKFEKELAKARRAFAKDSPRFCELDLTGLHDFRRNIRRWRYLLELALRRRAQTRNAELKRLIALQEALGEMQHCFLVRTFLQAHARSTSHLKLRGLIKLQEARWLRLAERHLAAVSARLGC
jgi:CHAD domain-containing protein